MIGGAIDAQCTNTVKNTVELVKDSTTGKRSVVARSDMWQARAAFGIAVYPNFS